MTAASSGSGHSGSSARSRRRKRKKLQRKIIRWGGLAVIGLLAIGAVIAAASYQQARTSELTLQRVRAQINTVSTDTAAFKTADGRARDQRLLDDAAATMDDLHRRLHGSIWLSLLRVVPLADHQRDGLVNLVADADAGVASADQLMRQVNTFANQATLNDGNLPLNLMPLLSNAVASTGRQTATLTRSASGLWGGLGRSRRQFNQLATQSSARLLNAAAAINAAQRFLGGEGNEHYLLALENNAEMRNDGMVLSYVDLNISQGRLGFGKHGSVDDIELRRPAPTPVPAGTEAVFGFLDPTQLWQSVNAGADFTWTAQAMADMYQQTGAGPTDGVIALDVPALAGILAITGPVTVPGLPVPISADNAVEVLLHDVYIALPSAPEASQVRHEVLGSVASAMIDRLRGGVFDTVALGRTLADAAAGGHMKIWSRDPAVEPSFERAGLSGDTGGIDPTHTFHVAVENRASNKLDYFLQVGVTQQIHVERNGDAVVDTTVALHNTLPPGLPPGGEIGPDVYGTTRNPGDYLAWVLLWSPAGSQTQPDVAEAGLTLSQRVALVPAGQTANVSFETVIPHADQRGQLTLRYVPQARLVPDTLSVTLDQGLHTLSWQGSDDRTVVLNWPVKK
jgi:hypothetical protein